MDVTPQSPDPEGQPAEATAAQSVSPRDAERASLRSLREHVARAVEEIVRLRAQNRSLARRLAEFESGGGQSTVWDDGIDADELKTRISSFITSIDSYLADNG